MKNRSVKGAWLLGTALVLATADGAFAASAWTKRMYDNGNSTNVGVDPALTPATVPYLKSTQSDIVGIDTCAAGFSPQVNHTPLVSDGLLFFGDWCGYFYVVDLQSTPRKRLIRLDTHSGPTPGPSDPLQPVLEQFGTYEGIQATPVLAELSPINGGGKRIYVGVNSKDQTLWCLDVTRIIADRAALGGAANANDGTAYLCSGWEQAKSLAAQPESGNESVLNGSPIFKAGQTIKRPITNPDGTSGTVSEIHDVLFTPSTGLDCANGQFFAMDAVSGERLWMFDPVEGDQGGTIWTVPALSTDGRHLYITTGDCVQKPQAGAKAESLVDLNPEDGTVQWYHQRRLVDTQDFDIGNAPNVVDAPAGSGGQAACKVIVSIDKDGCIYAFPQERSIPDIGEEGWDPLRSDQQRILWRQCFVPGSLGGGFDASVASVEGRLVFAQAKSTFGTVPGDDANAFALDACTGALQWVSSSIDKGWGEGAIASGMYFQPAGPGTELQVVGADSGVACAPGDTCFPHRKPTLLATVNLPASVAPGGGGPAIVDGKIYLPSSRGVVIVGVDTSGSTPSSPPAPHGNNLFKGPYPLPLSAAPPAIFQPIDPNNPYPLNMGQ